MYYKLICILYALLCGQNFILVKSGCYNMRPTAQSVGYHISLPRVIVDPKIIILVKLQSPPLSKIQVQLCEDELQTLMICV
jgi:hypothetical protein